MNLPFSTSISRFSFRSAAAALLSAVLAFGAGILLADEAEEVAAIRELLTGTQPGMQIESIERSPVESLYRVSIQNGQSIYISSDARFLIPGDLYEAREEGLVNLGELHRNELRRERIAALDEDDMIIFPAGSEERASLTVFTDVDCPYCRKLHGDIEKLNELGVTVRYLAFPRRGLDEETYPKMVAAWCSEDRKAMFTAAKRGSDIPSADCDNPVAEQYQLGRELGVTGTPALVFEDGTLLPGYVPAETLAGYLFAEE